MAAGLAGAMLASCGAARPASPGRPVAVHHQAAWTARRQVHGVVDLSRPYADGTVAVAAAGHLLKLGLNGRLVRFAASYSAPPGLEPYIALSSAQAVPAARCRFPADALYALRLARGDGVSVVGEGGLVRRFAALPRAGLEDGIAFDVTGHFGHRLLVSINAAHRTAVFAIDCRGRVALVTRGAPRLEGGLVVAPAGFGRFGGDLIAPDERSGNLYAVSPDGRTALIVRSGVAHGPDTGVESEGFVPSRYGMALVADRRTPGNRHPGDDELLGLSRSALAAAGASGGDLLVTAEGGAATIAVSCHASCRVRRVATGPREAHIEGHIVFTATGRGST